MKRYGFTLAEVLITLAIIGVVAALTIPSVISNTQQQEFKTGLRKAVSVLNSAITMSMAIDGESPYDNGTLMPYLMKHMAVMKSTYWMGSIYGNPSAAYNAAFYTTDGMRFEFRYGESNTGMPLYESPDIKTCMVDLYSSRPAYSCNGCGSYGLNSNTDNTTKPPCLIMVDVNGDRKPNPHNVNCKAPNYCPENRYKLSDPDGKKLTDLFTIMITDKEAIPYGIAAQRAMYSARK